MTLTEAKTAELRARRRLHLALHEPGDREGLHRALTEMNSAYAALLRAEGWRPLGKPPEARA